MSFSLSLLVSCIAILHVLQSAFLFFPAFQCFSPYSMSYKVCVSFSMFYNFITKIEVLQFYTFSLHIPIHTVFVSYFTRFSVFFPQSSSYSVYFSYLKFFTVSYHVPCPAVCVSHFTRFQCFSPYCMSYYVSFSFSLFVIFFTIFQVLQCVCLILQVFPFPCHNPGPIVYISHVLRFSMFLAIFQVIQFLCLIFQFLQFSCHNQGPKVFISHI